MRLQRINSLCLIALCALLTACGGGDPSPAATVAAAGDGSPPTAKTAAGSQSGVPASETSSGFTVSGMVSGLSGAAATITLGNDQLIVSAPVDAQGVFRFAGLPNGSYFIKAEARNFRISPSQVVLIGSATAPNLPYQKSVVAADNSNVQFSAERVASNGAFNYHWEADTFSVSGSEHSASTVTPPVFKFLDQPVVVPDAAAVPRLMSDFNIVLSDEGGAWTQEYAARLLETLRSLPIRHYNREQGVVKMLKPSKWILTDAAVANDIAVIPGTGGDTVTLSRAAFVYATPKLVLLNGARGSYFSLRLHHAAVRYVTADGTDTAAADHILRERFGVSLSVPNHQALTAETTRETAASFSAFRPAELMSIISMFEEMPRGYHQVKGLKYLLRRNYGQSSPIDPRAAAMAWPLKDKDGYIEFMDGAFVDLHATHRMVIHEKTHFMWANLFDDALRRDWAAVGGWYRDSASRSGWSTTQTTQFVSEYAHQLNPNEDLAESTADYILNPALLRARAPNKYTFIEQRIMRGDVYVPVIRPDLTFQVYNLYPDLEYPGKIRKLDLSVTGAPDSDKLVKVDIELFDTDARYPGAVGAFMIVYSDIGTQISVYLDATNTSGTRLSGTFTISKYARSGYWAPAQITLFDQVGNRRMQGARDFGWQLYVNNTLEGKDKATYVPKSLSLTLLPAQPVAGGHTVQKLQARWRVEGGDISMAYATLRSRNRYLGLAYGTFDRTSRTVTVEFDITEFHPSDVYHVAEIMMFDEGHNYIAKNFSPDVQGHDAPVYQTVKTSDPDLVAPELDLNRISITATPTNPQAPNGETIVTIVYFARDDKSGLGLVHFRLLDPQGGSHFHYHQHANFYTQFFSGDPRAWTRYEAVVRLPAGSPPGTWGLQSMQVADKAGLVQAHNFVELVHFTVEK